MIKQCTLKRPTNTLSGKGLHTGITTNLTLFPAPSNYGIKFQRIDLVGKPIVPAHVDFVISTTRSTSIKNGNASISTIEHLLSALVGLEVDNVLIKLDGPEVPILDGSAKHWIEVIENAGIQKQAEERIYFEIKEEIEYIDKKTGSSIKIVPSETYSIQSTIDFNSPVLGVQEATLDKISDFKTEISMARTFVFLRELEVLLDNNLIKGGDISNAIVIVDRLIGEETLKKLEEKTKIKGIKVEKTGVLNNIKLHFPNEAARHKLLDLVGDFALIGMPIKAKVLARKPGHTINYEFAKIISKNIKKRYKMKDIPIYDPTQEPIMDSVKIMELLPHRHPFLMVEKIIELSDTHVVGIKNVAFNEDYFRGHFPGNPIFPGVLQMEALAQAGGILAISKQEDPEGWDTYFLKINNAKFKRMVKPGDTLILKMELMGNISHGIIQMKGTAFVGGNIVSQGELTAKIQKRKKL